MWSDGSIEQYIEVVWSKCFGDDERRSAHLVLSLRDGERGDFARTGVHAGRRWGKSETEREREMFRRGGTALN